MQAQEDSYTNIRQDVLGGVEIQEIADRAYDNSEAYWEYIHGHERKDHDHPEHSTSEHDGTDEELSAGEAVSEIYANAIMPTDNYTVDPAALNIVKITTAVVDAWPDCQDTFDAVRAAVALQHESADEIIATVAVKRDCNCSNGGLWLDRRVDDRISVEARHAILDVPVQCSCSQVAMYAGIAGLPEKGEFDPAMSDVEKAEITGQLDFKPNETLVVRRMGGEMALHCRAQSYA